MIAAKPLDRSLMVAQIVSKTRTKGDSLRIFAIGWVSVFIAGCSIPAENPYAFCEVAIKGKLLNPETAEFFDFTKLTLDEFKIGAGKLARSVFLDENVAIERNIQAAASTGSLLKTRIRAEGKLGNKITSTAYCSCTQKACQAYIDN